ncbi:MAG: flagellar basal-body rod protein FlgG [Bdellovibrionales bacterium RIFOXYD12_FULL_39_22]|nr:MAG: flagellar basal-body rod protein FlgG [Bdellovibrionales bacterium RIFOXYB1_FULL_39_21]OFZ42154.1 MAG: flagellar basal-body rod protein FlgG [Bdellovibrionales bacterium RIFOXYC12_FULL_39_17]OFZ50975.1 MAG: flagellar basal-body rod protein FlgG [Bdellovibrionales bacterium RIFOXYC1_FULL_39_130]OFZ78198.1 MAG: flagellar basal-body rod protein FlgG [Bdellovibrionales bacterium RIFOXYD1_FULL_39_84]OFZ93814.1 MAG: flagellar basal-body rod protein FlgG [Bdellovibrionales bacterium RIFOXYD12_
MTAINTAATGMAAQETNVNTISNNIANVNTTGFKRGRAEFEDLIYETRNEAGSRSSGNSLYNVGTQIGTGARVSAVRNEFSAGNPQVTNNPYDLMISGEGFFGIIMPNNELRFTRDGAFSADANGILVTKQGYKVFPTFTIPPNAKSMSISENGVVDIYLNDQLEPTTLGVLPLFTFINNAGLKESGGNLYRATQSSGAPIQGVPGEGIVGAIMQGTLETSNVNIMTEMTNLIRAQRAYEMNAKVMGVADQMLQTATNIR